MKKSTDNWLTVAEKDLKCAKLCLDGGESLNTITLLHAAVEKILKGICSELIGDPPKIHSLQKLAVEVCKVSLEEKQVKLLGLLDDAFIDSRYPDDVAMFEEEFDIENCKKLYIETREVFKCLKNLIIKS